MGRVTSAAWSPSGDRFVTGHADGIVRVWEGESGRLVWHKVLAPVVSRSGYNASPAFVAFSGDGRRIITAGRRDDPVEYRNGIVAIYEAFRGLLVARCTRGRIPHAALSPDRRMVVVATANGSANDTHLLGIEVETGRTLWATPSEDQRGGLDSSKAFWFRPDSASLIVALASGDVIRFDAHTGKPQGRFLADWAFSRGAKDGPPEGARSLGRRLQHRRPHAGLIFQRMGLRLGRRYRQAASKDPTSPRRTAATLPWLPTARRLRPQMFLLPGTSATTPFACMTSNRAMNF